MTHEWQVRHDQIIERRVIGRILGKGGRDLEAMQLFYRAGVDARGRERARRAARGQRRRDDAKLSPLGAFFSFLCFLCISSSLGQSLVKEFELSILNFDLSP